MILDFTYKAPLCMEVDDRPFIIASVHYMYFAAGLFLSTGLVTILVSLLTSPPRDYMLVRTTFQTRKDQRVRKDEHETVYGTELDPLHELNGTAVVEVKVNVVTKPGCLTRVSKWILGIDSDTANEEKHHKDMEEHVQKLSTLQQTTSQKVILYTNLVIIVSLAIFLYTYFSISPFTPEKLSELKTISLNRTITEIFTKVEF